MKRISALGAVVAFTLLVGLPSVRASTVYVMTSGDTTTDAAVQSALQNGGHTVTLGVSPNVWNGTQATLANYQAVVLLSNHNWNYGDMPSAGVTSLINFVSSGGGLVTGEWLIWNATIGSYFSGLKDILPATCTSYVYTTTTTYTVSTPDSVLSSGVSSPFTLTLNYIGGAESILEAKSGATVYYKSSNTAKDGVVGWSYSKGKVLSFSTLMTSTELANSNYKQLLVNAVKWAAGSDSTQNPSIDITMSKTTYTTGDIITANTLRVRNPSSTSVKVKIRIWLKVPVVGDITLVDLGGAGDFSLPGSVDSSAGPISLITITASFPPRGTWEFNTRLTDPTSNALLSEDINSFVIQ